VPTEQGGQPPIIITEAGLAAITAWAAKGLSAIEISRGLSIGNRTLAQLRKRCPEVDEAMQLGTAAFATSLVNVLYEKALKGDTVSCIFLLKAKAGLRDQGPVGAGDTTIRNVNILNLPAPMNMADYLKMVQQPEASDV